MSQSVVCSSANPRVIQWARESMDISVEEAAHTINVDDLIYIKIEAGDKYPTLSHLKKLALLYKRPMATFYLPKVPADTLKPKDYRLHGGTLSKNLLLSIRRARDIQSNYRMLVADSPKYSVKKVLWSSKVDPEETASLARKRLGLTDEKQRGFKNSKAFFEWLVKELYSYDIQVLLHSFPKTDARAYSLNDEHKVIVISTNDNSVESRIFSLFHELSHLSMGSSGLCLVGEENNKYVNERKCDLFAVNTLMPETFVRQAISEQGEVKNYTDSDFLKSVSNTIKCSQLALLYRLEELDFISQQDIYRKIQSWKRGGQRKSFGRTNRISTALKENGNLYSGVVLDAYGSDRISTIDAARMLNINQSYLERVGARLGRA